MTYESEATEVCVEKDWLYVALSSAIRDKGATILIGSAISQFSPTSLAPGAVVVNQLANCLSPTDSTVGKLIKSMIRGSAFEHVLDHYPNATELNKIMAKSYAGVAPNSLHEAVASGLRDGRLTHVITTNYDCALEEALGDHQMWHVVDGCDAVDRSHESSTLFKFHGCVSRAASIVASLSQEGTPPVWKTNLLRELIRDKVLIVCGYSGQDFEVCPELAAAATEGVCKSLIWIAYSKSCSLPASVTPNAQRVINAFTNAQVVKGDMAIFLQKLLAPKLQVPKPSSNAHSPISALCECLTNLDWLKWRISLFISIGAPTFLASLDQPIREQRWGPTRRIASGPGLARPTPISDRPV